MSDHWWAKTRDVAGLWLDTDGGSERFLFYEGTGRGEPTVMARIEGGRLHLDNRDVKESGRVLVVINDGKDRYLREVEKIAAGGSVAFDKADIMAKPVVRSELKQAARRQWSSYGMTEEEAKERAENSSPCSASFR